MTHKIGKTLIIFMLLILAILFIIRAFSARYLDDLHPDIQCDETLIQKSGALAVIPRYNNISISDAPEWCNYIQAFNKTPMLHGYYHTYREFSTNRDELYIKDAISEFKDCFGYEPTEFKPPQLAISKENRRLLEDKFNFTIRAKISQIIHKTYHCQDTGIFPNWLMDLV